VLLNAAQRFRYYRGGWRLRLSRLDHIKVSVTRSAVGGAPRGGFAIRGGLFGCQNYRVVGKLRLAFRAAISPWRLPLIRVGNP
jgi:hypothetical protein